MDSLTIQNREALSRNLAVKAWKDPVFQRLLEQNPRAAIEEMLGAPLPEDTKIVVHAEEEKTVHLVLPSQPVQQRVTDDQLTWLMDINASEATDPPDCSDDNSNCNCTDSQLVENIMSCLEEEEEEPAENTLTL